MILVIGQGILMMGAINVKQVAIKMGHKNVATTQHYLRFPMDMIKSDFPSLAVIIDKMSNMPKNVYLDTKNSDTVYSNIPKLTGSVSS